MAGVAVATVEAGGHAAAEAGGRSRAVAAPLGADRSAPGVSGVQVRWFPARTRYDLINIKLTKYKRR